MAIDLQRPYDYADVTPETGHWTWVGLPQVCPRPCLTAGMLQLGSNSSWAQTKLPAAACAGLSGLMHHRGRLARGLAS